LPVKIVRPFNTYGPLQSARAIIPTVITQILSGVNTLNLGNITPTRDFTFVKDTAEGFFAIGNSDKVIGEITNIGMGNEISIRDLVEMIEVLMNKKIEIVTDEIRVRPDKSEVERLCCNNVKIKKMASWKPDYDLESGLSETIKWLEKNIHLYKPGSYNV